MGIFSKTPAEKKLEELTGGFSLSEEYKALLKANGIDFHVGEHIRKQLREEIKLNIVSEEGLQTRLRYLISQNANKRYTKLRTNHNHFFISMRHIDDSCVIILIIRF